MKTPHLAPGKPLKKPKESFQKGRNQAGLHWVRGLHDLRHYRATQWHLYGVDIQTVKYYLGHKRIETTQDYCTSYQVILRNLFEQHKPQKHNPLRFYPSKVGDIWETVLNCSIESVMAVQNHFKLYCFPPAGVAELADAPDSKSGEG